MVERVERLRADRHVDPFRNLEVLEQVQVHVEVVRPAILIAALRGEGDCRNAGIIHVQHSCGAQAFRHAQSIVASVSLAAAAGLRVSDDLGRDSVSTIKDRARKVAVRDRIRQSRAPERLARELPAIDQPLQRAGLMEFRIEDEVTVHKMTNVVIGVAIVILTQAHWRDLAQDGVVAFETILGDTTIGGLVNVVRPGVIQVSRDPFGELLSQTEREPVVVGDCSLAILSDGRIAGGGCIDGNAAAVETAGSVVGVGPRV